MSIFTHALATNNYGEAKFIVDPSPANGTHTTIASALTAATSGDTIFIRQGTYTENISLKAGVNLCAYGPTSSFFVGSPGGVIINGTCTMTTAGTVGIKDIVLQTNGAAALAVTGSAASLVHLENCYLNCTTTTGVTFSSSSGSAQIQFLYCMGDLTTTGIALFAHSSAGSFRFIYSKFGNSGGSTTNNTVSAGGFFPNDSSWANGTTLSNAASMIGSGLGMTMSGNQTGLTTTDTATANLTYVSFTSGTASAISLGTGTTLQLHYAIISSSNANAIAGTGTLGYTHISFNSSSGIQSTVIQTAGSLRNIPSITTSTLQPAFLAHLSADTAANVTGNGTTYTAIPNTEDYDQNSNYNNATGVFTAPITARYHLAFGAAVFNLGAAHTEGQFWITTSNRIYICVDLNMGVSRSASNTYHASFSALADMDAADTATNQITVSGSTLTVGVRGSATNALTYVSGNLEC